MSSWMLVLNVRFLARSDSDCLYSAKGVFKLRDKTTSIFCEEIAFARCFYGTHQLESHFCLS